MDIDVSHFIFAEYIDIILRDNDSGIREISMLQFLNYQLQLSVEQIYRKY